MVMLGLWASVVAACRLQYSRSLHVSRSGDVGFDACHWRDAPATLSQFVSLTISMGFHVKSIWASICRLKIITLVYIFQHIVVTSDF